MVNDPGEIAKVIETHEAMAWAACMEATAAIAGNPLKAEVDRSGNTPLSTLAALNFGDFNRVVALGVETPATEEDIDAVQAFYAERSQSRYLVEVTPTSQPQLLADSLIRRGLRPIGERVAKCWQSVDDIPRSQPSVEVRELSVVYREQWAAVNTAAWEVPKFFEAWFGATLGSEGFRHYGVFDGDRIVSTGAIFVTGHVAWSGFSATLPEYRGRGYQVATHIQRLQDAAAMGCRIVHTEAASGTPELPSASFHNQIKVGFTHIYNKDLFAPAVPVVTTR